MEIGILLVLLGVIFVVLGLASLLIASWTASRRRRAEADRSTSTWVRLGWSFGVVAILIGVVVVQGVPAAEDAHLPSCATSASLEPTGDLAKDLVGAWRGTTSEGGWHHPVAYMAPIPGWTIGERIWMFRPDGTGHVWTAVNSVSGGGDQDEEFDWKVTGKKLVVGTLPPATVEIFSDDYFLLHPIDEAVEASQGLVASRCEIDVPEDVRALNS